MENTDKPVIGVLALQGAVTPHEPHIQAAGGIFKPVKTPDEFEGADGLILPGGESTTMLTLIRRLKLWDALEEQLTRKPVWGICAGSILLAARVENPAQDSFGLCPITVQRNGYGRQNESHHAAIDGYTVSFIRAPTITDIGGDSSGVKVLASHRKQPVWLQYKHIMISTFHPELTHDAPSPMHRMFISTVQDHIAKTGGAA